MREGASKPAKLLGRARELGYDALALTDHDALYGSMEFATVADVAGIRPITGAEMTMTDGGRLTLTVHAQTVERYEGIAI